jgi:hypothetical protein
VVAVKAFLYLLAGSVEILVDRRSRGNNKLFFSLWPASTRRMLTVSCRVFSLVAVAKWRFRGAKYILLAPITSSK